MRSLFICRVNSVNTEMTEYKGRFGIWRLPKLCSLKFRVCKALDWFPLAALPVVAVSIRRFFPSWVFMWVIASAIFLGCKWLTWRKGLRNGSGARWERSLSYFLLWPGMDAVPFLSPAATQYDRPRSQKLATTRSHGDKQPAYQASFGRTRRHSGIAAAALKAIAGFAVLAIAAEFARNT